jgi:hypothetical protein
MSDVKQLQNKSGILNKKRPIDEDITLLRTIYIPDYKSMAAWMPHAIINNWPVYKEPKFCTRASRSKEKFLPACVLFSFLRKVCCWRFAREGHAAS